MTVFLPVGPEVDWDASVKERMVVHAGGVIRIIAYVSGQPTPEITWSRDGSALPLEAKVETTVISSALVIKPCSRKHLGVYTLTASNAGGEKKKTVTVEVLGNCCSGVELLCKDAYFVTINQDTAISLSRCPRTCWHPFHCREPEQRLVQAELVLP